MLANNDDVPNDGMITVRLKPLTPIKRTLESLYDLDCSEMPDPSSILRRELQ